MGAFHHAALASAGLLAPTRYFGDNKNDNGNHKNEKEHTNTNASLKYITDQLTTA